MTDVMVLSYHVVSVEREDRLFRRSMGKLHVPMMAQLLEGAWILFVVGKR